MRIIFLGHCSFNTIKNLTDAIKNYSDEFQISVVEPYKYGGELTKDDLRIFDEVLKLPLKKNVKYNLKDKFHSTVNLFKDKSKRQILLKSLFLFRLISLNRYINSETEENVYSEVMKKFFEKYDIFHFHYLAPGFLLPMKYIEKGKRIILSVWGSDLLQISGVDNYRQQLEAFERADVITMYTLEMREIFLSKFGRHLSPKIILIPFGQPDVIFSRIDSMKNSNNVKDFRTAYNIPANRLIISIGYNSLPQQSHIEILNALGKLENTTKEKFHVIIPMSYGKESDDGSYLKKVEATACKAGVGFTIITEYMHDDELIKFLLACDIKLNLRETDCMNAAMLESLYSENIVVNGAWLAYGKLKRLGIYYREIENINELKNLIPYLIENCEIEKRKTSINPPIVRKFISYNNTIKDWIDVYNAIPKVENNSDVYI